MSEIIAFPSTRRDVLAGAASAAATLALPASADDSELLAAYEEWRRCERACMDSENRRDELESKFFKLRPKPPPTFATRFVMYDTVEAKFDPPLVEDQDYKDECRAIKDCIGYTSAQREVDRLNKETDTAFEQFMAMPSNTIAGVHLKLAAVSKYMNDDGTWTDEAFFAALRDTKRLSQSAIRHPDH